MATLEPALERAEEPAWDIAKLFPNQGEWSEKDYLSLDTNYLVEFTNGYIELLPMPTIPDQQIVLFLYRMLWEFAKKRKLGEVLVAPLRVCLRPRKYREPDVVFMLAEKLAEQGIQYWENVDLVMEVVSPDDPSRDYEKKRTEYAQVGIAEYWIVNPMQEMITVLALDGETYQAHGVFKLGTEATSVLLNGFAVDVAEVFAAAS